MKIKVTEAFTNTPGGRFLTDGLYSGEEFRLKILAPAYSKCIENNEKFILDMDGSYGYPIGFLEESFGGLIRMGYSMEDLLNRLEIVSNEDKKLESRIKVLILEATKEHLKLLLEEGKKLWEILKKNKN